MSDNSITPVITMELLCGDAPCRAPLTSNIVMVLKKVDQLGSLYAATKRLHMGYSNTLYAICGIEEALGYKLLERTCSKGSVLTEEGRQLADLYEFAQNKTAEFAASVIAQDERSAIALSVSKSEDEQITKEPALTGSQENVG